MYLLYYEQLQYNIEQYMWRDERDEFLIYSHLSQATWICDLHLTRTKWNFNNLSEAKAEA